MGKIMLARSEVSLAAIFAALAAITFIWPTWIELLFEASPDGGTGEVEWVIVAVFAVLAIISALVARRTYRAMAN